MKDFKIENLGTSKDSQYRVAEKTLLKALTMEINQAYKPDSANLNAAL
jgi:carboxyl-terminal processing protease